MNRTRRLVAIGVVASTLTLGMTGVVAAAGINGKGPASVLSGLVSDGTLTQEQADKVADALKKKHEEMRAQGEQRRNEMQALVAKTLGLTEAEVKQAREDGKSLAQLSGDKRDALIAAMVKKINTEIDQAVADGKLTSQQASDSKGAKGRGDSHGMVPFVIEARLLAPS